MCEELVVVVLLGLAFTSVFVSIDKLTVTHNKHRLFILMFPLSPSVGKTPSANHVQTNTEVLKVNVTCLDIGFLPFLFPLLA